MTYDDTFHSRCDQYMHAVRSYPLVMQHEYRTAVDLLDLESSPCAKTILHFQAGGIPLNLYVNDRHRYVPVETSAGFARWGYLLCSYDRLPVEDDSVDRFIVVASLHHASIEERTKLYRDVHRAMQTDGKMILGDVRRGSKQDRWLNEFVHRHNVSGHIGMFFEKEEEIHHLARCGWRVTSTPLVTYPWVFDDRESLLQFTRQLFGLNSYLSDETVMSALSCYLDVQQVEQGYHIAWELLYLIAEVSEVSEACDNHSTTSCPIPSPPPETDKLDDPPTVSE